MKNQPITIVLTESQKLTLSPLREAVRLATIDDKPGMILAQIVGGMMTAIFVPHDECYKRGLVADSGELMDETKMQRRYVAQFDEVGE